MNSKRDLPHLADQLLHQILSELGFTVTTEIGAGVGDVQQRRRLDLVVDAKAENTTFHFAVETKSRITPQTAYSICDRFRFLPPDYIPVVFTPVVSPRVATIIRNQEIGYLDGAGNCWLKSKRNYLLVERRGMKPEQPNERQMTADLFAPKSSRIVRAMLAHPHELWEVRSLANHQEVKVSVGLVSKIRHTLIEEGYAIEHLKRLRLFDPIGLLENWAQNYQGPIDQIPMYVLGLEDAQLAIGNWCKQHRLRHALAGLSAAWQLAPEVRHSVTTVYVEAHGFDKRMVDDLTSSHKVKRVDSGANLLLWRPFDPSVFASAMEMRSVSMPVTSPLQTYLDVKHMASRGDEAAVAIFDRYLRRELQSAAEEGRGIKNGKV